MSIHADHSFQVNTRKLMMSGMLIGLGGMIGLVGVVLGGSTLMQATREWARNSEVPPPELARRKLAQARSAAEAGMSAWHDKAHEIATANT